MQEWYNFYLEQTFRQAFSLFDSVMITTAFEKKQMRAILEDMKFEEFVGRGKEWLTSARFVWFVHGNIAKEQAIGLVEKARSTLDLKKIAKEDLVDVRCVALPAGKSLLL
jgi:secreted Zn-dependent insulinase-like peptidase